MIPIAGLALTAARWMLESKLGRILLLTLAGLAAFGIYTAVIEHRVADRARTELVAQEKAATQAEHERRERVLNDAQREAAASVARLRETENRNALLVEKVRRQSARHDGERALSRDVVRSLRAIGESGQPAGR